ncbi:MAG: autotransporter-associated beta strand repeat-containing protein, partial [Luteolibacter sp.]
ASGGLMTMNGNHSVNIGAITLNGGELSSGGFSDPTYGSYYLNGDVTAGTGTSTISAVNVASAGARTFTVASGGTLNVTGRLSGIYGALGVTKAGDGTMVLSGANTYTGATSVTLGTLALVGGSQTSPITVSSGAALGFTVGSPTTSTSTVTFSGATAKVTVSGSPAATTLMTASSISGIPVLDPAIPGFTLAIEGSGTLLNLKASGSPYTAWAGGFPGFSPTTGTLDFDKDGIQNLLEFVLGGNPKTNDSPSILPTVSASGSDLVVTFSRTDLSETEPVTVKVQTSSDQVIWADFATIGATSDIPSGYTVAENGAAADTVVATIPKAAATKKFARVSAE